MRLTHSLRPMFVFMEIFFATLINKQDQSFRQALSYTYGETFGSQHTFILRQAIKLAIWAAPSDDKFCDILQIKQRDELREAAAGFYVLRQSVDEFLKDKL